MSASIQTGAPGETIELSCGCKIRAATRTSGRTPLVKCEEASRLWAELRSARDELRAAQWSRVGKKPAIDAFAAARDAYHAHVMTEEKGETA